jgi:hypothetical protein
MSCGAGFQPAFVHMPWQLHHPTDIPRDEWLARLDTVPNASPYLLPEWSQFWEDVWPNSRAEVFDNGQILIPTVSRKRYGLAWRFAQPYGTDCIIGHENSIDWTFLVSEMSNARTVEIAISADVPISIIGWKRKPLKQSRWVINVGGRTYTELSQEFSSSHRRNIAKGEALQLQIEDTHNPDQLIRNWQDRHRDPRFMLNPKHAQSLIKRFSSVGALVWRTAWAGERPVAGTLFLTHKNVAVSVDTIVDRDPQFRGAGHNLVAETLKSLVGSGITQIDLGGVPGGSDHAGLDEFKSGWAASQMTTHTTLYRRDWYSTLRRFR